MDWVAAARAEEIGQPEKSAFLPAESPVQQSCPSLSES